MVEHNANIFAVDDNEETPFDSVALFLSADEIHEFLIETYGNKLTQEHGQLASCYPRGCKILVGQR